MMKNNLKHLFSIFCLLMLFPEMTEAQEKFSDVIDQQVDSIFDSYENRPGIALAIIKKGKTLFKKGYGLANLEYDIPITSKTVFDATAMAKQVTAACVFLLEKEDKLSLDDSVQKFLTDFPHYDEREITIGNLIYQTSGVRSYLAILFSQNRYFGDRIDNEDAMELIMNQRNLNFQPGLRQDFSNSNYVLLAEIIKKVSGKSLAEYAKEKLFEPLAMTNTFFLEFPGTLIKNRAIAYQSLGENFSIDHFFNSSVIGDGGLFSTLEDVIKWSKNLSSGAIGGKDIITKMMTPGNLNSGEQTIYGGGLFRQNHYDIEGLPTVRHSGEWAGFRSLYYKFINQDTAFILLSNNADTNVWGLLDQLTPFFLANEIAAAQSDGSSESGRISEIELSGEQELKFVGDFYDKITGNIRAIKLEDGRLFYHPRPNRPGSALLAIGRNELVFEAAPFIKLSFTKSYGEMALTIHDQQPSNFKRYRSHTYSKTELKEYENNFYNEDLDVVYQIKSKENQLQLLIDGKELVVLDSFSRDMFREEHFGYITFERDKKGKVKSFSRTDNTFTNLVFHVLKSTAS